MAVVAPMPMASVSTTTAEKPGVRRSERTATRIDSGMARLYHHGCALSGAGHSRYAIAAMSRIWIGTSGYNYPEWKGSFYPEKMKPADMLAFYGQHFDAVEINYTFYRMPNAKNIEGWTAAVPEDFRFVLK